MKTDLKTILQENFKNKTPFLDLSDCELTGKESELQTLDTFKHIKRLSLEDNRSMVDIGFLKNLPLLKTLEISGTSFFKDHTPLLYLKKITKLEIGDLWPDQITYKEHQKKISELLLLKV